MPKLVATFETQNNYYLIQQYISWVFKKVFRTVDFLTAYDMDRITVWSVLYGPCHIVHIIWTNIFEIPVSGGDFFYHLSHERLVGLNKSE